MHMMLGEMNLLYLVLSRRQRFKMLTTKTGNKAKDESSAAVESPQCLLLVSHHSLCIYLKKSCQTEVGFLYIFDLAVVYSIWLQIFASGPSAASQTVAMQPRGSIQLKILDGPNDEDWCCLKIEEILSAAKYTTELLCGCSNLIYEDQPFGKYINVIDPITSVYNSKFGDFSFYILYKIKYISSCSQPNQSVCVFKKS